MKIFKIILMAVALLSISCGKLNNKYNELAYTCGNSNADYTDIIPIRGVQETGGVEVFRFDSERRWVSRPDFLTEKKCIQRPSSKPTLLVRTPDGKRGAVVTSEFDKFEVPLEKIILPRLSGICPSFSFQSLQLELYSTLELEPKYEELMSYDIEIISGGESIFQEEGLTFSQLQDYVVPEEVMGKVADKMELVFIYHDFLTQTFGLTHTCHYERLIIPIPLPL